MFRALVDPAAGTRSPQTPPASETRWSPEKRLGDRDVGTTHGARRRAGHPVGPHRLGKRGGVVARRHPTGLGGLRRHGAGVGRGQTPAGLQLHCIVDNLSGARHPQGRGLPRRPPCVFLHNTPTHASWLNQVELFFSILERRLLRSGEFDSVEDLASRIIAFIKDYNRRAKPFRWTYDGRPLKVA